MADLTPKEWALRDRVTRRTVYTWIEKGALVVRRTPGGKILIPDDRQPAPGARPGPDPPGRMKP